MRRLRLKQLTRDSIYGGETPGKLFQQGMTRMRTAGPDHADEVAYPSSLAFVLVHLGCLGVIWTGVSVSAACLGIGLYLLRIFAVTAGYHRYFSHRAFRTSRVFQFCLAFLAQTSAQRGVLWWAAKHRMHHRYSDTENDVHSPLVLGFLHAHIGWIFVPRNNATDHGAVRDLSAFRELRWLDRFHYLPPTILGFGCWLFAGWTGLVVGFLFSTVTLWHATFSINSLAHLLGKRRYVTGDQSRNNWLLALMTMGEGWHNNHHAYQSSARQGFRWWEYDMTYYVLCALSWIGLVWDLHVPPKSVVRGEQKLGRLVIDKVAGQLAASFPVNVIAGQVLETLAFAPNWADLKARLLSASAHAEAFWNEIELPHVPTLDEVRRYALARLAQTPSIEEIAVSTRRRLLELVHTRLLETMTPAPMLS
jgi:stearoyl-CoA desaturase (delta-9 desaturase)